MKYISVLGSTGSIGTQTLEVVRNNSDLKVIALAVGSNIAELEKQIEEFNPQIVCVWDSKKALELETRLMKKKNERNVEIVTGMDGLIACATVKKAEVVVTAMVGMIGIKPTIAAIQARKDIALANKETLVTAGHIIMPLARENKVKILPVDSEHSAIFQALNGENKNQIQKLIITASGGPFRGRKRSDLKNIRVEEALNHPNWSMGRKITIDSSTMINKGLEVIEAKWLFDVSFSQIQVVIQPQSVIHSMVEFKDGAVMAQLGTPDMKLPIQYALYYPERKSLPGERLEFSKIGTLNFEEPDLETFQGLKLAYEVGEQGGSYPTVYNAANERAVALFLNRKIGYLDIIEIINYAIEGHKKIEDPSIDEILQIEQETYQRIDSRWSIC